MPEFLRLLQPDEALKTMLDQVSVSPQIEDIQTEDSLGRVIAEDIHADYPLPNFRRSTVDGYAVSAKDTFGASDSLPAYLKLIGEVTMGAVADQALGANECALIHTGGMLPEGADAVVMVEYTQQSLETEVEIMKAVGVGENVIQIGEDVAEGELVIPAGTKLRPAEVGGLMALGVTSIKVATMPLIGIISSGDEVVPPQEEMLPGQVRDINSYTLKALVEQTGGVPRLYGIIEDTFETMVKNVSNAIGECDLVIITAGSSASTRDLTAKVIDEIGDPGVLVHGVNVKPGKPTILSIVDEKPVIGLPGNPVSALVIAGLFVVPVIKRMIGLVHARQKPRVQAVLGVNVASSTGREEWVPVKLIRDNGGLVAEPIFGRSNLIFTLAKAEGLIRIEPDNNGILAGETVDVWLM
jgi:molybdopterin molybdotransferase